MTMGFHMWLGGAMAVFLAAGIALRRYVDTPALALLVTALVLYTLGNLMMVRLMRESGMAVAISLSAVLQLLLANAVAIVLFKEHPSPRQLAGIALGVAAVALIVLPQGARDD
ncbi:EamA family transporter [Anianabacter salinae]|uniref:EamA family transporter n=1 Tax=Anianabacter salinae TaxID=2851023 RepID=UPI00225E5AAC|nr:EamA family transporter [Anianabacter salinae]MBV0912318.1 EamA family transporter [Anianabacter salinae]